jgi:hypothetical protein
LSFGEAKLPFVPNVRCIPGTPRCPELWHNIGPHTQKQREELGWLSESCELRHGLPIAAGV